MKVLFMAGTHPHHISIARALYNADVLAGLVIEQREVHVPLPPSELSDSLVSLFNHHFECREASELRFFGNGDFPDVDRLNVSRTELNSQSVHQFIVNINPEILLSYGVHKLTNETISRCKGEAWNIHGGLSPWYRGCITHFWPSYFLEPQMTGMTVHELTQDLDGGNVVHQNSAELVKGDGLHDLACRAVLGLEEELPDLFNVLNNKGKLEKHQHKTTGKIWTSENWRPEHLKVIYEYHNDKIVDMTLAGEIVGREPVLYRQFKT